MTTQVNLSLATLSDQLVLVTVLLYLSAMISYALDLAFSRTPATATVRQAVLVGAVGAPAPQIGSRGDSARRGWTEKTGRIAVILTSLGCAANLGAILALGLAVDRWPWGNMYEFVVAICFAAVAAFLTLLYHQPIRFLGAFVTLAAVLGLGFSVLYLHVQAGPVVPALNSYWIAIHVTAAVISSGLFTVAAVAGVLHLVRRPGRPSSLPSRDALERIGHQAISVAFPIWTFAVIAGAMWADKAWGRYWGWDPKEVWAFVTWVVYAAYLHARSTGGWKGTRAVVVQLVAFGCLLFNLVGVNIFMTGLHSYAGLN